MAQPSVRRSWIKPRVVDEGPGFQEGAYGKYVRTDEMRLPGVRWHLSCESVIALRLSTATPYAVEIVGGLNIGDRQDAIQLRLLEIAAEVHLSAPRIWARYSKTYQWETFLRHGVVSPALLNPSTAPEPGYNNCGHAIAAQSRPQPFLPLANSPLPSGPEANYKNYSHTLCACSLFEFYVSGCRRPLIYCRFAEGVKN